MPILTSCFNGFISSASVDDICHWFYFIVNFIDCRIIFSIVIKSNHLLKQPVKFIHITGTVCLLCRFRNASETTSEWEAFYYQINNRVSDDRQTLLQNTWLYLNFSAKNKHSLPVAFKTSADGLYLVFIP